MKGLSFSEAMVKSWLAGNKTVTRRLMKPQPDYIDPALDLISANGKDINPRYLPGETVYIRENFRLCAVYDSYAPGQIDSAAAVLWTADGEKKVNGPEKWGKKRSGRFMPEKFSRSHALIVSVRPEQIRSITPFEAAEEGCPMRDNIVCANDILRWFRDLWESLHHGSWERNEWVWRIELEEVKNV
jgi:hypothetical protein